MSSFLKNSTFRPSGAEPARTDNDHNQDQQHDPQEENMNLDPQKQDEKDASQRDLFEDELDAAASRALHVQPVRAKTIGNKAVQPNAEDQAAAIPPEAPRSGTPSSKNPDLIQLTVKIDRLLHGRLRYQSFKRGRKIAELVAEYIDQHCPEL